MRNYFSIRRRNSMLIALIDDGIDTTGKNELEVMYDLEVLEDGTIRERKENEIILTEHGTTCARIIKKYAPQAVFCSLRIFLATDLLATSRQLIQAMRWCKEMQIPLVHMSVGTSQFADFEEVRQVTADMLEQGQIIVAACNNRKEYTVPACLGGVFGVQTKENLKNEQIEANDDPRALVPIYASSIHELTNEQGRTFFTAFSNSYAAPTVTAVVHNILSGLSGEFVTRAKIIHLLFGKLEKRPFCLFPDFLTSAVVINLDRIPLRTECFCFKLLRMIESKEELHRLLPSELTTLVILPGKEKEEIMDFLLLNEKNLDKVLYCDVPQERLEKLFEKFLVWNLKEYKEIIRQLPADQQKIECPIVYLTGEHAISIICELQRLLRNEEYNCICCSDEPYAYLYTYFIPTQDQYSKVLECIYQRFQPDIILCGLLNNNILEKVEEDLVITVSDINVERDVTDRVINLWFQGQKLSDYIISYFL